MGHQLQSASPASCCPPTNSRSVHNWCRVIPTISSLNRPMINTLLLILYSLFVIQLVLVHGQTTSSLSSPTAASSDCWTASINTPRFGSAGTCSALSIPNGGSCSIVCNTNYFLSGAPYICRSGVWVGGQSCSFTFTGLDSEIFITNMTAGGDSDIAHLGYMLDTGSGGTTTAWQPTPQANGPYRANFTHLGGPISPTSIRFEFRDANAGQISIAVDRVVIYRDNFFTPVTNCSMLGFWTAFCYLPFGFNAQTIGIEFYRTGATTDAIHVGHVWFYHSQYDPLETTIPTGWAQRPIYLPTGPVTNSTLIGGVGTMAGGSGVVLSNGAILLAGGFDGSFNSDDLSRCLNTIYTSTDGANWKTILTAPWEPRLFHQMIVSQSSGRIWLFGGFDGVSTSYPQLWISDDSGTSWTNTIEDGSLGLVSAGSVWIAPEFGGHSVHGDIIWCLGHSANLTINKGCYRLDGGSLTITALVTDLYTSIISSHRVGGTTAGSVTWPSLLVIPKRIQSPKLPMANILLLGGNAWYTSAGFNYDQPINDIWSSSDLGLTWSQLPPFPSTPRIFRPLLIDCLIHVMGGYASNGTKDWFTSADGGYTWRNTGASIPYVAGGTWYYQNGGLFDNYPGGFAHIQLYLPQSRQVIGIPNSLYDVQSTGKIYQFSLPPTVDAASSTTSQLACHPRNLFPPANGNMGTCHHWISSGNSCSMGCVTGYLLVGSAYQCVNGQFQVAVPPICQPAAPFTKSRQLISDSQPIISDRGQPGLIVRNGVLFMISGYSISTAAGFSDIWSTPDAITWTHITTSLPFAPKIAPGLVSESGRIWIELGGLQPSSATSHTYYSDDGMSSWVQALPDGCVGCPAPRIRHSHVVIPSSLGGDSVHGDIIICGGLSASSWPLNDCWRLGGSSLQWTLLTNNAFTAGYGRYDSQLVSTIVHGQPALIMVGGNIDGTVSTNSVYRSIDGGLSWSIVFDSTLPPMSGHTSLVIGSSILTGFSDRNNTNGADIGLYQTIDFGMSWKQVATSTPWEDANYAPSASISVIQWDSTIIAASGDIGIWTIPILNAPSTECNFNLHPLSITNGNVGSCAGILPSGSNCSISCPVGFMIQGSPFQCINGQLIGSQSCAASSSANMDNGEGIQLLFDQIQQVTFDGASFASVGRSQPGLTVVNNVIYVMGGATETSICDNTIFSSSNNGGSWNSSIAPFPGRRMEHVILTDTINNRVFIVGGDGCNGVVLNDVWFNDDMANVNKWKPAPTALAPFLPRTGFSQVWIPPAAGGSILHGDILVCGGLDGSPNNDCWRVDGTALTSWVQVSTDAFGDSGRYKGSLVLSQSNGVFSLIMLGGQLDDNTLSSSIYVSTGYLGSQWNLVTLNAPWSGRSWSLGFSIGSSIFYGISGFSGDVDNAVNPLINDLWESTDAGLTWSMVTKNMPWVTADIGTSHAVYPTATGSVFIYASSSSESVSLPQSKGLWRLPYSDGGWTTGAPTALNTVSPLILHLASMVKLSNGTYVQFGGIASVNTLSYSNAVYQTTDGMNWVTLPQAAWSPRAGLVAHVSTISNRITMFGGVWCCPSGTANGIWLSDDGGSSWFNRLHGADAYEPSPRQSGGSVWISPSLGGSYPHGDILIISGGPFCTNTAGCTSYTDVWRLDQSSYSWSLINSNTPFSSIGGNAILYEYGGRTQLIYTSGIVSTPLPSTTATIYRSLDFGVSWLALTSAAPFMNRYHGRLFQLDQTLHFMFGQYSNDWWQSTDGGVNWNLVTNDLPFTTSVNSGNSGRVMMGFNIIKNSTHLTLVGGMSHTTLHYRFPRVGTLNTVICPTNAIVLSSSIGSAGSCIGSLTLGQQCSLTCNSGYILRGQPYTCTVNGTLSGSQTCVSFQDNWTNLHLAGPFMPNAPTNRRFGGLVYSQGFFLYMGGLNALSYSPTNDIFISTDGRQWAPRIPTFSGGSWWSPRAFSQQSIITDTMNRIWLFGGGSSRTGSHNDVWTTSDLGLSWMQASGALPGWPAVIGPTVLYLSPTQGSSLMTGNNHVSGGVMVMGGWSSSVTRTICYQMSISNTGSIASTIRSYPPISVRLYASSAVVSCPTCSGGVRIFFGMGETNLGQSLNDVFTSNDLGLTWSVMNNIPISPRTGTLLIGIGTKLLLGFGGISSYDTVTNIQSDTWLTNDYLNWNLLTTTIPLIDYGSSGLVVNGSLFHIGAGGSFKWMAVDGSSDASLSSLSSSSGPFTPAFSSHQYLYNQYVSDGYVINPQITLTTTDPTVSSIRIQLISIDQPNLTQLPFTVQNGQTFGIGLVSSTVSVNITVTSNDGTQGITYAIFFIKSYGGSLTTDLHIGSSWSVTSNDYTPVGHCSFTPDPTSSLQSVEQCLKVPIGGLCSFTCAAGFMLAGSPLLCQPDGTFLGSQQCIAIPTWTSQTTNTGGQRTGGVGAYCGNMFYIGLGVNSSAFITDFRMSTDGLTWVPATAYPIGYFAAGMVCLNGGVLHCFGGLNTAASNQNMMADVHLGGISSWSVTGATNTPSARYGFAMLTIPPSNNMDYLVIGGSGSLQEVVRYRSSSNSWTSITTNAPFSSIYGTAAYYGYTLIFHPGQDGGSPSNQLYQSFDDGATWFILLSSYANTYWSARQGATLWSRSGSLYFSFCGGSPCTDLWQSMDGGLTWVLITTDTGNSRRGYVAFAQSDTRVVIGGGGWDNQANPYGSHVSTSILPSANSVTYSPVSGVFTSNQLRSRTTAYIQSLTIGLRTSGTIVIRILNGTLVPSQATPSNLYPIQTQSVWSNVSPILYLPAGIQTIYLYSYSLFISYGQYLAIELGNGASLMRRTIGGIQLEPNHVWYSQPFASMDPTVMHGFNLITNAANQIYAQFTCANEQPYQAVLATSSWSFLFPRPTPIACVGNLYLGLPCSSEVTWYPHDISSNQTYIGSQVGDGIGVFSQSPDSYVHLDRLTSTNNIPTPVLGSTSATGFSMAFWIRLLSPATPYNYRGLIKLVEFSNSVSSQPMDVIGWYSTISPFNDRQINVVIGHQPPLDQCTLPTPLMMYLTTWVHLGFTIDTSYLLSVFINGVKMGQVQCQSGINAVPRQYAYLGTSSTLPLPNSEPYFHSMAGLYTWRRALSDGEMKLIGTNRPPILPNEVSLINSGSYQPDSGQTRSGSFGIVYKDRLYLIGGVSSPAGSFTNYMWSTHPTLVACPIAPNHDGHLAGFSGTDIPQLTTSPNKKVHFANRDLTFSLWALQSGAFTTSYSMLWSGGEAFGNGDLVYVYVNSNLAYFGTQASASSSFSLPPSGTWFHLCGTYSAIATHPGTNQGAIRIWLNGDLVLDSFLIYDFVDSANTGRLRIGYGGIGTTGSHVWGSAWLGNLDEFRLYTRALSEKELLRGYRSNQFPSLGLIVYYPFNETSGRIVHDYSGNNNHAYFEPNTQLNWGDSNLPTCYQTPNWQSHTQPPFPSARYGVTGVVVPGYDQSSLLYVFGGFDINGLANTNLWSFDGNNWSGSYPYAPQRAFAPTVFFNNELWTLGGLGTTAAAATDIWTKPVATITSANGVSKAGAPFTIIAMPDFNAVTFMSKRALLPGGVTIDSTGSSMNMILPPELATIYEGTINPLVTMSQLFHGRHYLIIDGHRGGNSYSYNLGQSRDIWAYEPFSQAWAYVGAFGSSTGPSIGGIGNNNLEHRLSTPIILRDKLVMLGVTQMMRGGSLIPDQTVWVWPGVQFTSLYYSYTTSSALNSLLNLSLQFGVTGNINIGTMFRIYVPNVDLMQQGRPLRTSTSLTDSVPLTLTGSIGDKFLGRWSSMATRDIVLQTADFALDLPSIASSNYRTVLAGQQGTYTLIRNVPVLSFSSNCVTPVSTRFDMLQISDLGSTSYRFPAILDIYGWSGISLSLWFFADSSVPPDTVDYPRVFSFRDSSGGNANQWQLMMRQFSLCFNIADGGASPLVNLCTASAPVTGVWYSLVITCSPIGSQPIWRLYLNGQLQTSVNAPIPNKVPMFHADLGHANACTDAWHGQIAEFHLFKRTLNQAEVAAIGINPPEQLINGSVISVESSGADYGPSTSGTQVTLHGTNFGGSINDCSSINVGVTSGLYESGRSGMPPYSRLLPGITCVITSVTSTSIVCHLSGNVPQSQPIWFQPICGTVPGLPLYSGIYTSSSTYAAVVANQYGLNYGYMVGAAVAHLRFNYWSPANGSTLAGGSYSCTNINSMVDASAAILFNNDGSTTTEYLDLHSGTQTGILSDPFSSNTLSMSSGLTLVTWILFPTTNARIINRIVDFSSTSATAANGLQLYTYWTSSVLLLKIEFNGTSIDDEKNPMILPMDRWIHLSVSMESNGVANGFIAMYLDGQMIFSSVVGGWSSISTSTAWIGRSTVGTDGYSTFAIASWTLWSTYLSMDEVNALYLNPPRSISKSLVLSVTPNVGPDSYWSAGMVITLTGTFFGCSSADISSIVYGPYAPLLDTRVGSANVYTCLNPTWLSTTQASCQLQTDLRTDVDIYFHVGLYGNSSMIRGPIKPTQTNSYQSSSLAYTRAALKSGGVVTLQAIQSHAASVPLSGTIGLTQTNSMNGFVLPFQSTVPHMDNPLFISMDSTIGLISPTRMSSQPTRIGWNITGLPTFVRTGESVTLIINPILNPPTSSVTIMFSIVATIHNVNISLLMTTNSFTFSTNNLYPQLLAFTAPTQAPSNIFITATISGSDQNYYLVPTFLPIPVLVPTNSLLIQTTSTTLLSSQQGSGLSSSLITFTPSQPILSHNQPLLISLSTTAGTLNTTTLIFTPVTNSITVAFIAPIIPQSVTITAAPLATGGFLAFSGGAVSATAIQSSNTGINKLSLYNSDFSICSWVTRRSYPAAGSSVPYNSIFSLGNSGASSLHTFLTFGFYGPTLAINLLGGSTLLGSSYTFQLNTWYHVCTTMFSLTAHPGGSRTRYLYVNGVAIAQDGPSADFLLDGGTIQVGCGKQDDSATVTLGGCLNGGLDELRVWKRVLSVNEISRGYSLNQWVTSNMVAYYPMNEQIGLKVYDRSGYEHHLTTSRDYLDWQMSDAPILGSTQVPSPLPCTIGSNDGYLKLTNSMTWRDVPTRSMDLSPALILGSTDITVSLWVNRGVLTSAIQYIFMFGSENFNTVNEDYSRLMFGFRESTIGGTILSVMTEVLLSDSSINYPTELVGSWSFYTVTFSSFAQHGTKSIASIYYNSNLLASTTFAFDYRGGNSLSHFLIGCGQASGAMGLCFQGSIDEVRIYNRLLGTQEIRVGYQNNIYPSNGLAAYYPFSEQSDNTAFDHSGNGQHLTSLSRTNLGWEQSPQFCSPIPTLTLPFMSSSTLVQSCSLAQQYDGHLQLFDGVSGSSWNVPTVPAPLGITGDYSWSIWIQRAFSASISDEYYLFSWGIPSGTSPYPMNTNLLSISFKSGNLRWYLHDGSSTIDDWSLASSFMLPPETQWEHWVGTFNSATQTRLIYRNGAQFASKVGVTVTLSMPSTPSFRIGAGPASQSIWLGGLDELRLFSRTLTPSEVSVGFSVGFWNPTNLELYFDFAFTSLTVTTGTASLIDRGPLGLQVPIYNTTGYSLIHRPPDCAINTHESFSSSDSNLTCTRQLFSDGYASFPATYTGVSVPPVVTVPSASLSLHGSEFSVCMWIRRLGDSYDLSSTMSQCGLFATGLIYGDSTTDYRLYLLNGQPTIRILSDAAPVTQPTVIPMNQWTHLCHTYHTADTQGLWFNAFYINGAVPNFNGFVGNSFSTLPDPTTSATSIWIGSHPSGSAPFIGHIDEVYLWKRAVSEHEIILGFQSPKNWNPMLLQLYLPFNETDVNANTRDHYAHDYSGYGRDVSGAQFDVTPVTCTPMVGLSTATTINPLSPILQISTSSTSSFCSPLGAVETDLFTSGTIAYYTIDLVHELLYWTPISSNSILFSPVATRPWLTKTLTISPSLSGNINAMVYDHSHQNLYVLTGAVTIQRVEIAFNSGSNSLSSIVSLTPYTPTTLGPMVLDETHQFLYVIDRGSTTSNIVQCSIDSSVVSQSATALSLGTFQLINTVTSMTLDSQLNILYLATNSALGCIVRIPLSDPTTAGCLIFPSTPIYNTFLTSTSLAYNALTINPYDQVLYISNAVINRIMLIPLNNLDAMTSFIQNHTNQATNSLATIPHSPVDHSGSLLVLDTSISHLYRIPLQSGLLSNLSLGPISLVPAFSPTTLLYNTISTINTINTMQLVATTVTCGATVSFATTPNAIDLNEYHNLQWSSVNSTRTSLGWSLTYVYLRVVSPDQLHTVYYRIAIGSIVSFPPVPMSFNLPQSFTLNVISGFNVIVDQLSVPINRTVTSLLQITPLVAPIGTTILQLIVNGAGGTVTPNQLVFTSIPSGSPSTKLSTLSVSFTAPMNGGLTDISFVVVSPTPHAPQFLTPDPVLISIESPFFNPMNTDPAYSDPTLTFSLTMPPPFQSTAVVIGTYSPTGFGISRGALYDFLTDRLVVTPGLLQNVSFYINSWSLGDTVTFTIYENVPGTIKFYKASPRQPGQLTSLTLPTTGIGGVSLDLSQYNMMLDVGQSLAIRVSGNLDATLGPNCQTYYVFPATCSSYDPNNPCTFVSDNRMDNWQWSYIPTTLPGAQVFGRSHSSNVGVPAPIAQYRTSANRQQKHNIGQWPT